MVNGTVGSRVPTTKKKRSYIQTLSDKSWDSTEEVLGHCSLGTVLEQQCLGTVLGQCSLGTVQSWGSLGTVQSWDSLGPEQSWYETVLGHWSWDTSLGTVVLGQ